MADLPQVLADRLRPLSHIRRWVIALSGGVDSRVLLELCRRTQPADKLLAVHVNHGLQSSADDWARQCESTCHSLQIPLRIVQVDPGSGSEADLREARYSAFCAQLEPGDCLLLGHHADDQAETLLLRLLRGAGPRGLAGMPWTRPIGRAQLYRPLLDQTRAELESWARAQGLDWIEDPSNDSETYDRNWLRHRILAPLRDRWPQLRRRVVTTTAQLDETVALLDEVARDDLAALQCWPERLPLAALETLSSPRQRNLLRYWVHDLSGHWLAAGELDRLEQDLIRARDDALPTLQLGRFCLRRYRQELYLLPALPPLSAPRSLSAEPGTWSLAQGVLQLQPDAGVGLVRGRSLRLDYRRGGERLRPLGRGGSVRLKQLLQEAGVPPWWRAGWPLLFEGDELVAVPGICLCEGAVQANGIKPLWQPLGLSEPWGFGRL